MSDYTRHFIKKQVQIAESQQFVPNKIKTQQYRYEHKPQLSFH